MMRMIMMLMIIIYLTVYAHDAICFHRECFLPSPTMTRRMLRCMVTEPSMRSPSYPTHWSSSDTSTASLVFWVRMMIDCDDCATDDDDDT